jgi:hypothetical protein
MANIHVFKVALKYRKRIWRKIAIRGDQTLDDLHQAIFEAFDRDDEHLYSFYFSSKPKSQSSNRLFGAPQYSGPAGYAEFGEPAAKARIDRLPLKIGDIFEYLFDYGDEWWHELTLVDILPAEPKLAYPRVVEAKGESPPQYPDMEE